MSVNRKPSQDDNPGMDRDPLPQNLDSSLQAQVESLIRKLNAQPYHNTIDDSPNQEVNNKVHDILIGEYYNNLI